MQYCEFPIYPFKPNLLNIQIFISFIKSKVLENPLRRVCDAAPFLGNCTVLTHGFLWRQKFLVQDSLGMTNIIPVFSAIAWKEWLQAHVRGSAWFSIHCLKV